jgi:hypothetical protein
MSVREWVKQWQKREDRATAVSVSKWGKKESGDRESGSSSPPLLCTSASFSGSAYYRSSRFDSVNSTICQYRPNQFFTISTMSSSIRLKLLITTPMFSHGPIFIWKFLKYRCRRIFVLISAKNPAQHLFRIDDDVFICFQRFSINNALVHFASPSHISNCKGARESANPLPGFSKYSHNIPAVSVYFSYSLPLRR